MLYSVYRELLGNHEKPLDFLLVQGLFYLFKKALETNLEPFINVWYTKYRKNQIKNQLAELKFFGENSESWR